MFISGVFLCVAAMLLAILGALIQRGHVTVNKEVTGMLYYLVALMTLHNAVQMILHS
jgi:uncharacterized membrane protein YjjP (DUF1212 family)